MYHVLYSFFSLQTSMAHGKGRRFSQASVKTYEARAAGAPYNPFDVLRSVGQRKVSTVRPTSSTKAKGVQKRKAKAKAKVKAKAEAVEVLSASAPAPKRQRKDPPPPRQRSTRVAKRKKDDEFVYNDDGATLGKDDSAYVESPRKSKARKTKTTKLDAAPKPRKGRAKKVKSKDSKDTASGPAPTRVQWASKLPNRVRVQSLGRVGTVRRLVQKAMTPAEVRLAEQFEETLGFYARYEGLLVDAYWKLAAQAAKDSAPATVRSLPWTHPDFAGAVLRSWCFCRKKRKC